MDEPEETATNLRAMARARPGYEEAVQDALEDRGEMFSTPPEWRDLLP